MDKVRVLQLGSPTGLYGAERWIIALIKHLDPEKVESTVAVIRDALSLEAPLCREAEKFGFRSHVIEASGRVNLSAVRQLRKHIQQSRIQVLHTHGYKTDLLGLLSTWGTGCKIVTTPHGWSRHADFKLMCYEMLDRCAFPFFDSVVPLSEKLYHELRYFPGLNGKLNLIQNGVDMSEIGSEQRTAAELARWKEQGAFILGYIGQLIPRKGLDTLIAAASRLDSLNWRLAIIGDGESRLELERLARDLHCDSRIDFFGFREDRISFLRGFDVFVLPSRLEGIPRCLMEAMAAGIPVISSDIPGSRDLITGGETGLLFPVDDEEALACRIEALAADQVSRNDFIRKGKDVIVDRFSAGRMARDYQAFYLNLAEGSK